MHCYVNVDDRFLVLYFTKKAEKAKTKKNKKLKDTILIKTTNFIKPPQLLQFCWYI